MNEISAELRSLKVVRQFLNGSRPVERQPGLRDFVSGQFCGWVPALFVGDFSNKQMVAQRDQKLRWECSACPTRPHGYFTLPQTSLAPIDLWIKCVFLLPLALGVRSYDVGIKTGCVFRYVVLPGARITIKRVLWTLVFALFWVYFISVSVKKVQFYYLFNHITQVDEESQALGQYHLLYLSTSNKCLRAFNLIGLLLYDKNLFQFLSTSFFMIFSHFTFLVEIKSVIQFFLLQLFALKP